MSYTGHVMFYPRKALDNFLINMKNIMRLFLLDTSHFYYNASSYTIPK